MSRGVVTRIATLLTSLLLSLVLLLGWSASVAAAELRVEAIQLAPCPTGPVGAASPGAKSVGASCFALRGEVINPTDHAVVDTDLFAVILDSSGEPVLPNRSRVGSLGDVPPGRSSFAVRLAVPTGTPGPFHVGQVKARGFKAPVRTRAGVGEEPLPLETNLS